MERSSKSLRRPSTLRLTLLAIAMIPFAYLVTAWPYLHACAVAPPPGAYVGIADETALIIWDADTKTQHFIRRATFDTKAENFGFLVPTPSKPELDEAHDYTFKMLEKITAPEIRTSLAVVRDNEFGAVANKADSGGIEVIEVKRVGDFDAVVLKADDAQTLEQWLRKNGFTSDPGLADWLGSYVDNKWFLTAFKITKEAKQQARATASAVRMSFTTDKPFFPYSEPTTQRKEPVPQRLLRVYLVAKKRMDGMLGEQAWPGKTVWAGTMPKAEQDFLMYAMRIHDAVQGENWWLTELEDWSSPRPGAHDVYFAESKDQSHVQRPPITNYLTYVEPNRGPLIPDWAILLGMILAAVVVLILGFMFILRPGRRA